ncbi:M28 family peptidase [soil metagenome]
MSATKKRLGPAAAKVSDAQKRMLETVAEVCGFERRLAGTDAERRAANHVASRCERDAREADVQPIHVHPQVPLVHALHCLIGFAASLVAVASAPVGFALGLLAATSMYLDLNGRLYLLRRLFFRRASQNVVSRGGNADAPAKLLIVANLDAARTGAFFDPKRMRRVERTARYLPAPYGPLRIVFWALAALLPLLGLRMAGVDSGAISALQLIPTLILLIGIFGLVDIELSDVVQGANTNASGVAVALELGAELQANPPDNLDAWVVVTGGGECTSEGMRSFIRSHRREFDPPGTFVLNLSSVGRGELRYVISQGLAVSFEMDRRLIELCDALAGSDSIADAAGHEKNKPGDSGASPPRALPFRTGFADEAFPARIARLRPISLTALGPGGIVPPGYHAAGDTVEHVDGGALENARSFALELISAIDRDIGRRQASQSD